MKKMKNELSLAAELTGAGLVGSHGHEKGHLVGFVVLDRDVKPTIKSKELAKNLDIWLEGHPCGDLPDQFVHVKHKDGRKAYFNPDDDNEGCKWMDDFDAICKECGSPLEQDFIHFSWDARGGGFCTNENCNFNKKLQFE